MAIPTYYPYGPLLVDNVAGKKTYEAVQVMLKHYGYYSGLKDGVFGPMTKKAFQSFLKARGHYSGLIDGDWGPMSQLAQFHWANNHAANRYGSWDSSRTWLLTQKALNWDRNIYT